MTQNDRTSPSSGAPGSPGSASSAGASGVPRSARSPGSHGSRGSPGERRLHRPPSERYRPSEPETPEGPASPRRGVLLGALAAFVLALALVIAGGLLLITAGLIAVAAIGGWAVGLGVRTGARSALTRRSRIFAAIALALVGVGLGQVALWGYAELEGGALSPIAYLTEVFGFLVPLEVVAAGVAAWLAAR